MDQTGSARLAGFRCLRIGEPRKTLELGAPRGKGGGLAWEAMGPEPHECWVKVWMWIAGYGDDMIR